MSKTYNILWIDDEHNDEALLPFILQAEQQDIILDGYGSFKEGFNALETNINYYDVILLDALFFEDENSKTPNPVGLGSAIQKINELKNKKTFPYFVLSGQTHFTDVTNPILEAFKLRCYNKKNPEDVKELLQNIKKEAEQQVITQLKHKFSNAFSLCEDKYLGSKEFARVLQLIKDIENPENISNQQDALLPMRKVLEAIFKKLNSIGLIPDKIQNGSGAINGASFFLAGNNKDYNYKEELIHPVIAESIWHLLGLTQDASHNEGSKLGADTYLSDSINSYLYQSLCFSLLEVLEYIKPFLDSNSDKKINQSKWELKETVFNSDDFVKGKITKVSENGKGTFESIQLSSTISVRLDLMKKYKLKEGSLITITTKPGSSKTSKFINEIMKVN
jgi:hypothetical protein